MVIKYSAEEVFQIGIDIERNGVNFYQAAAEAEADPDIKKLFTELHNWEADHIKLFEKLKSEVPATKKDNNLQDQENQVNKDLKTLADRYVFVVSDDIIKLIAKCSTSVDVLKLALKFEKDSVVLYTAMKQVVSETIGSESIDSLIFEEMKHVVLLTQKISSLTF